MSLSPLPSLDELAADPVKVASLSPEAARSVALRALVVLGALASVSTAPISPARQSDDEDNLLTTEEAAQRLGVSQDWLYRRAASLPFTVRLGRALRFSVRGLDRYIRLRAGR
jgi:excisionase family DNA binding protein